MSEKPFWKRKPLTALTDAEWESLCDGCARCCLLKAEDEETGEIHYTEVACRLLDLDACQCTNYRRRQTLVHDCVKLNTRKSTDVVVAPSDMRLSAGRREQRSLLVASVWFQAIQIRSIPLAFRYETAYYPKTMSVTPYRIWSSGRCLIPNPSSFARNANRERRP